MAPNHPATPHRLEPNSKDAIGTAHPEVEVTSTLMELKGALGIPVDRPIPMDPAALHRVDDLQDKLMAAESPEGRPPRRDLRIAEWRWLALAVAVVLIGGLVWAVAQGVNIGWIVLFGLLLVCLLGIGIGPVLYAGLLRGGEEKVARDTAAAVVKQDATLTR